ncbi:HEAT repeat domain-containing protein [Paenibacillus xylanexedens]|uniref:HEAT repeat domain-containing protein n=1 Tax=Paenibacillus xylanexedens TaxID=528191 RepID=UPI0011A9F988|nr:HEAT repeat domain-containing protein [Paenibacillus xylanexedens]
MSEYMRDKMQGFGRSMSGWTETGSNYLVQVTGVICGGVFVTLLIIYLILLWRNQLTKRTLKLQKGAFRDLIADDSALRHYFAGGEITPKLLDMRKVQQEALQEVLLQQLEESTDDLQREKIRLLAGQAFGTLYRTKLSSMKWSQRINTLLYIEQFQMTELLPRLEEMMRSSLCTNQERFIILRMYARTGYVRLVKELLRKNTAMSDPQYLQIMLLLTDEIWEKVIDHYEDLPVQAKYNVVDAMRIRNVQSTRELALLERLLFEDHVEQRIFSLRALAQIGRLSDGTKEKLLLAWQEEGGIRSRLERLMYARLLGRVHTEGFIEHLNGLMGDPAYEIRQEAANSLAQYDQGIEKLRCVARVHPDKYARQIAEETLERKQYERKMA